MKIIKGSENSIIEKEEIREAVIIALGVASCTARVDGLTGVSVSSQSDFYVEKGDKLTHHTIYHKNGKINKYLNFSKLPELD